MVFVARERELGELRAAFDQAVAGRPATVLVAGDAGVGKSRLVEEFGATLGGTARVLIGCCLDNGLPFAPFTSALRTLVTELGPDGVRALLPGAAAGELARLLPALEQPRGPVSRSAAGPGRSVVVRCGGAVVRRGG